MNLLNTPHRYLSLKTQEKEGDEEMREEEISVEHQLEAKIQRTEFKKGTKLYDFN